MVIISYNYVDHVPGRWFGLLLAGDPLELADLHAGCDGTHRVGERFGPVAVGFFVGDGDVGGGNVGFVFKEWA